MTNNKITAFYVHAPGIDNPIGMLRDRNLNGSFEDDEIYYFTKDHLGSVREIVGLDGKIKQRQRYSAYGRTVREKNDSELSRLIDQPYGFTSREHDSETGMYYYRARYYDPSVGRFVSEDPIGFEGGDANLYRYVNNNPARLIDPDGLFGIAVTIGGGFRFGTIGAEVNPIGFAVTASEEYGIQFSGLNSAALRFGPGAAIGAGISIGFSPNAQRVSDFEGAFIGGSADIGIGGIFGNVSQSSDGRVISTFGGTLGKGIGFGASLDLGYQNVIGGSCKK